MISSFISKIPKEGKKKKGPADDLSTLEKKGKGTQRHTMDFNSLIHFSSISHGMEGQTRRNCFYFFLNNFLTSASIPLFTVCPLC